MSFLPQLGQGTFATTSSSPRSPDFLLPDIDQLDHYWPIKARVINSLTELLWHHFWFRIGLYKGREVKLNNYYEILRQQKRAVKWRSRGSQFWLFVDARYRQHDLSL